MSDVYLARAANCLRVKRSLSTRVCSDVEMDTDVALKMKKFLCEIIVGGKIQNDVLYRK